MKHILVTGANGQVGQSLAALQTGYPEFNLLLTDRAELDITDPQAITDYFAAHSVDACINCAAYTAVDKAESEQALAHTLNAEAPGWLAKACAERGVPIVHFSTDYVYHGNAAAPYREEDATNPQSVYARTKLQGEQLVQQHSPMACIIRTSWVYAPHGHNFVKTMLRLGRERDQLRVVFDQVGTPTYAPDLAEATLDLLRHAFGRSALKGLNGIFHYSNEGVTSWYDFAVAIFDRAGITCSVAPIVSSEYPTPAQRPSFSVLNKEKIKTTFGLEIPHWQESLAKCLTVLQD